MEIDGFGSFMNTIYIVKQLHELGREDLIDACFSGYLDLDFYYNDMYNLISSVFPGTRNYYRDEYEEEMMIISDPTLTRYFAAAAEYGARNGIPEESNPHFKAIQEEAQRLFNFSYSLDWDLNWRGLEMAGRTRFVIYMSGYDFYEHDRLAYSLLMFQIWLAKHDEAYINQPEVNAA
jgi:hypothetical protein